MDWHKVLPARLGAIVLTAVLLLFMQAGGESGPLATLERFAYDRLLARLPQLESEARIVLVDIDEAALARVGPWPWPRETIARLLETLTGHYQVALLGVDMVFPNAKDGDARLGAALAHPTVIMGQALSRHSSVRTGTPVDLVPLANMPPILQVQGYVANEASVHPAAARAGHISPLFDADGLCRRVQPVLCLENGCSPSLPLRMYQMLSGGTVLALDTTGRELTLSGSDVLQIPLDSDHAALTPYRVAPGGFVSLSAAAILEKSVPLERLQNLVVLIGSTALGLGDRVATPRDTLTPGLEIHAQWLSALLDQQFIRPAGHAAGAQLALVSGLILLFLFWPGAGLRGLLQWTLGAGVLVLWAGERFWVLWGVWGPNALALTAILCLGLSGLLFESLMMKQQMRLLARHLAPLVPDILITRLLSGQAAAAGTERQIISVLVADLRGFSAAAVNRPPEEVAALAQKCLTTMAAAIEKHGGIVEKYTGDGLMALWGATGPDPEHARHAVTAALAMQDAMQTLTPWLLTQKFPPARVSIGINSGEGAVGLYGGDAHMIWSAHGDAVNLATRIEQLTREVGCDLLLGEMTAQLLRGHAETTCLGQYNVKGREDKISVYTLGSAATP